MKISKRADNAIDYLMKSYGVETCHLRWTKATRCPAEIDVNNLEVTLMGKTFAFR